MKTKKLKLMTGEYTLLDYSDWLLFNKQKWTNRANGYAGRVYYKNNKQYTILLHREIMKATKKQIVDHINRNTLDNRKCNLRFTTKSLNAANCKTHKHNTSGFKGVSKSGNKWRAYIVLNNKQKHIGCFSTKEEAAVAYNKKAIEFFKDHANLNKV